MILKVCIIAMTLSGHCNYNMADNITLALPFTSATSALFTSITSALYSFPITPQFNTNLSPSLPALSTQVINNMSSATITVTKRPQNYSIPKSSGKTTKTLYIANIYTTSSNNNKKTVDFATWFCSSNYTNMLPGYNLSAVHYGLPQVSITCN